VKIVIFHVVDETVVEIAEINSVCHCSQPSAVGSHTEVQSPCLSANCKNSRCLQLLEISWNFMDAPGKCNLSAKM